jgi:hypothetical protein
MKMQLVLFFLVLTVGLAQAEPGTLIQVQLKSGSHTSKFEVTQADSSCLYGTSNGDDWRTLYSTDAKVDDNTLSTALLLIPNTTQATNGSSDFFFSAGVGEYGSKSYFEYILDPANTKGSGTVTVKKDGDHATLEISGKTATGVTLNTTIICNTVLETSTKPKALSDLGNLKFAPNSTAPTGSLNLTIGNKNYQVQTGSEATCSRNPFGLQEQENLFGYSYFLDGYNSLDLFIPNFEVNQSTTDFGFAVDNFYLIYRTGEGTGTLKANQDGNHLTLTIDAKTPEGIPVQATLKCFFE